MNGLKLNVVVVSLFLLVVAVQNAFARSGRWEAEQEVAGGGWHVAYGKSLSESDAIQGLVEPGVSIYARHGSEDMDRVHSWADGLIRQATALMVSSVGPDSVRDLDMPSQRHARRLAVRSVREMLRNRQFGAERLDLRSVEVKAGVMEYREGGLERWTQFFVPYVAFRQKQGTTLSSRRQPAVQAVSYHQQDDYPIQQQDDYPVQQQDDYPIQQQNDYPIQQQKDYASPRSMSNSSDVLDSFSLTNSAQYLGTGLRGNQWRWTAYIQGPTHFLKRIHSVNYHLHPSFRPSVQQGNKQLPGHPLTATGWGVFELRADVVLDDGAMRSYQHMLRFK